MKWRSDWVVPALGGVACLAIGIAGVGALLSMNAPWPATVLIFVAPACLSALLLWMAWDSY